MFYVEKWHRDNKKELAIIHIGPPIIVMLAFLGITIWTWVDAKNNINTRQYEILNSQVKESEALITNRLKTYEDILRSGVGLFDSSNEVTRQEWRGFVNILDIEKRYPGVQGLGYAEEINSNEVLIRENYYRDTDYPNFSIYPAKNTPLAAAVAFLEPKNPSNDKAVGFDMRSEQRRKDAMDLAKKTGDPAITDVVTLIQDQGVTDEPGFLMYVPHYSKQNSQKTPSERERSLIGYVYAPFRSNSFFKELTNQIQTNGYGYQVYDEDDPKKILYQSDNFQDISKVSKKEVVNTFRVANQTWTIRGTVDPSIVTQDENNRPISILWLGTFFSIFLALFIYMLLMNRTRALSSKEENEIQNAKDELLALASHQLRTPATGVKQYLGLLREGYAGSLNKDQREYIKKAYESNERQLTTINQMLFVARSDAGKIKLTIRHLDLAVLLRDILDEQKSLIKEKQHKLEIDIPEHPVDIYGDEQYLRMALENVINNAVKYTAERGEISIALSIAGHNVKIVVEDNGVGVKQTDLPLLFRKFSRIPNELTSKVSGSGIGLYLTKSIIKAHNGTITFESVVNTGSLVTITLPSKLPKETGYL